MKQSIDAGLDSHPEGDPDQVPTAWSVAVRDDCDPCADLRLELVVEEVGRPGEGMTAHLSAADARQLRAALGRALQVVGEPVD